MEYKDGVVQNLYKLFENIFTTVGMQEAGVFKLFKFNRVWSVLLYYGVNCN